MREKLVKAAIIIFGVYLIVSLVKDLYGLSQKGKEVEKSQAKLKQVLKEKNILEKQLDYVKTPEFVEKEARDKLGMSKPGETIVILPDNIEKVMGIKDTETEKEKVPNWKKWLNIFLKPN